jgi:hypothetical protein
MTPHAGLMSKRLISTGAAAAAAAVLAIGAYLLGSNQSDSTANTANTGNVPAQQGGQPFNGQPPGFRRGAGLGDDVTGDAAQKVEKAVAAKYDGQIERVQQLSDGSYVAHVITNNGEIYVTVSKSFEVTGTQQGPRSGMPPGGAIPGSQSGNDTTTS